MQKSFEHTVYLVRQHCIPEKVVAHLSDDISVLSFSAEKGAQFIVSSGKDFVEAFLQIIPAWVSWMREYNTRQCYDSRNEDAVRTGAVLATMPSIASLQAYETGWGKEIALRFARSHRTLQQRFASLLYHIARLHFQNDESFIEGLKANGLDPDYWADMPFV